VVEGKKGFLHPRPCTVRALGSGPRMKTHEPLWKAGRQRGAGSKGTQRTRVPDCTLALNHRLQGAKGKSPERQQPDQGALATRTTVLLMVGWSPVMQTRPEQDVHEERKPREVPRARLAQGLASLPHTALHHRTARGVVSFARGVCRKYMLLFLPLDFGWLRAPGARGGTCWYRQPCMLQR